MTRPQTELVILTSDTLTVDDAAFDPVVAIVFSVEILLAAVIPITTMHIGVAGVDTFPEELEARNGYVALQHDFSAGPVEQTLVVISGDLASPPVRSGTAVLENALNADPRFGEIEGRENNDGNLKTLESTVAGGHVTADPVLDAVRDIRSSLAPAAFDGVDALVLVTGDSAETVDYLDTINGAIPVVIPFVLILSFVLLTLASRSLVVPIKAIIMNMLSVGAAYGLMVLVFEKGVLNSLLGFHQVDTIEAWVPLFLFAVFFGLSMDYHVFMLSRIREHFDRTGDNIAAVALSLSSTGRLITGASLIMVAVFVGFAAGNLVMFEQMGFGMSIAIFLDAILIRSMLVPASMKLLGKWNWWSPSWLEWLPDFTESESFARPSLTEPAD